MWQRSCRRGVAPTARREVKCEWGSTCEDGLLVATKVIRVVMRARVRGLASILHVISTTGRLLLLIAVLAAHWVRPARSGSRRCLDTRQTRNARQPALAFGAPSRVMLVPERLTREWCPHVLLPDLFEFLETLWRPCWSMSRVLLRAFLTIRRGCIAWIGTGGRAIPPRWVVRRAMSDGVVKEGCTITKAGQDVRVIKRHEPKGRGESLAVLDDAISRCRTRVRLL